MESGNGGASSKGILVAVSTTSDAFQNNVLAPLKSAYLYEESKQFFRYMSAALIKNPALEKKYNAFRAKRREVGYSEEELKESYGFLLFDDVNKANALGETGVLTGNSTCTTLGDPSNGVYISMYSDCLDLNRWYHGKSGYIAIIRLTTGRVKKVLENYTQNFTAPTEGFDCHVSEQLPLVSDKTSSFLAFERTQYYMYELLDDGSNETVQSPSAACPFAIVSFSYTDTQATLVAPQEKSEEKNLVCHYFPWRGQLQIGTHFYDVGLRSTAGALIPAELPPVVKADQAISMPDLRQLLPRVVFETCFSGEVSLDGLYCSLCEFVSSEAEVTSSLSVLLCEIKERDVALAIPLNDGGFLILLHSSHFLTYDDSGSSAVEVLQGIFVFPHSRVIHRDTDFGQRKPAVSSEILRVLPVLSYAEGEAEKTPIGPSEELCEVFAQHMQSYAALINPGLALSPSRDFSIFPDQYDVPDAHKHLYISPEWTSKAWQNLRSYLSRPVAFQLPVSKASEILAAGQEERIEDLNDIYFCPSSPEEESASIMLAWDQNHVSMGSEDQLTGQKSAVNAEISEDSCIASTEGHTDQTVVHQNVVPDDLQAGDATKDTEKSDLAVLIKTDDMETKNHLTPSTSDDLPAELIVSITSAKRTVTETATKHNDFHISGFPAAKLQMAGVKSLNDGTVKTSKVFDCPELTSLTKTKRRKLHWGHSKSRKRVSKACVVTPSLQTVKIPVEDDDLNSQKEDQAKESSGHPQLSNPSNIDWRKGRRRKHKFGKLSSKNKKLRSSTVGLAVAEEKKSDPGQQSFESTILMEFEVCPLRKKMERWDLKPVISECGRILVPHGSVDIADRIMILKDKLHSTKDEPSPEKMLIDASVNAHDTVEMEKESCTATETAVEETETTTSKGGGNHPQNIVVTHVNPEHSILRQSDDGNGSLSFNPVSSEHSSENDGTDTSPLKAVQEKNTDNPSPVRCATKGEYLLTKLKSVLLRGKRKTGILVSKETTVGTAQDTEPCLKKIKTDSDSGMLKDNDTITSVQDTNLAVKEVSKMLSVDPLFAYALGLTPKETPDKIQKSESQDTQHKKDSSETQEQTILDKQSQSIQRPLSIFPRRGRIKTLKKHQGISAEYVRKKWWLHFQTPACFASEKLKYKACTRDNSVINTVQEKSNSACSSTDALNLLADLALSASNDQVPPQPDPALERKPETSLKKSDLTKDVTSAEQESVLHALLRQSAARHIQPLESPSPSHLVGGSELVGLVSKEHAYSLPPSSSPLLGLSGTAFQVSPLSGSTRLLHHHQTMYGDGIKTLPPSVDQDDRGEHTYRTPEYLKKHKVRRRKFRHSRTFVNKDGSVQVTKQWKENYDFNLDSKFTSDSKDRAIIRALHGPWDFSIQDTSEEVQLIVHMWIGLFYSRSTSRFFHVDSNCTNPFSEESDSLEMSSGMVSAPAKSELKANSFVPLPNLTDTSDTLINKALDLSKKDNSVLDPGSVLLDLSLRNDNTEIVTSDPQVSKKETSVSDEQKEASEALNTLKSSMVPRKCHRKSVNSTEINKGNDVGSASDSCTPFQKAGCVDHMDVPSFKCGGTLISQQDEMENISLKPENHQTSPGIGPVSHGCNSEKTDSIENSEATQSLVQKQGRDSSTSVTDKEVDSNKNTVDVVHTTEHDETESRDGENCQMKEKPCQEANIELSQQRIHTGDDSTNGESGIVCNGNLLENEKLLSREEPKAVSPCKAENVNENVDYCTAHEDKIIEDDHFGKEDGLDEKDRCISDSEGDSDLNDQPLPLMSDGPHSAKKDCIIECNRQAPLDGQPPQADKDTCHDLQFRKLCTNGSALTDEHAVSEEAPHTPSEMKPIDNEPAVEENSKNGICLADLSNQPLPMICEDPDSVKDCTDFTDCNRQTPLDEQPLQADNKKDAFHDLHLRKLCANGSALTDEHAISEDAPHSPSEMKPVDNEPGVEKNFVCLADKVHCQKAALSMSAESTCTLEGSSADGSVHQTNDSVETGSQNKVCSVDHEDRDTKSVEGEQNVDNTTQNELFHHQSLSPQCEAVTRCQVEVALTKETSFKNDKTNKGLEKIHGHVVIPFIGIDTSGEDVVVPDDSHSEDKVEEVRGLKEIPFISETTYPETVLTKDICSTSQMYSKKVELSAGQISLSLLYLSEPKQPEVSGSESDNRCPTPTMDEEPYQYSIYSGPSSSSAFSGSQTCKNKTQNCLSRSSTFRKEKMPLEQKHKSTVNSHPNPHHGVHDLELRTLRVLQSVDNFLSKSSPTDTSSEIKTSDEKHCLDQTPNTKEVLGVRLQQKKDYCHPHIYFPSSEFLQATKPDIDHDGQKTTSQTSLGHDSHSYSQYPVIAVKPLKSDGIQADCISQDRKMENSVIIHFSKNKQIDTPVVTHTTPSSMLLEKKTESLKGNSSGLNDEKQEASELSSRSSWLSNASNSKSNSDKAKFALLDPLNQYEGRDISKFNKISSSSLPMQSFESAETSCSHVDGNQSFLTNSLVEKVGQTTTESIEMDQKDCSDAATSVADYKDGSIIDDSLFLQPQSSLICTVYNTSQEKSASFLEQLSQRCLQDNLTQASMEQECLIFSEQMKQLLKRSMRGPIYQLDAHDKLNLSCSSPVTVNFSSLEEWEDLVDHLDAPLLVGQKLKVDMSNRKDLANTTEEENTLDPQKFSQGTSNPLEHAGVSGVTTECARLYTTMMNDVCAVRNVLSRPKHFGMDRCYPKAEPSSHFDFCDQMKREVDESFRSNLNSVVKKSCKAKYRFYLLVTSEDAFFEETKAHLEAEGHTAVQPSEFFLVEDSSSSLLIILRNEDIAEHICEVPHLLELKKSTGVQFAGIDEPDDVVNLTHQELFLRGGFIMFDRAALESLSLCNMEKLSKILQELSKMGKWKWMLHYRDSRQLKGNARLSAEAKEKKHFLNWCQEMGILETLPYHECDLMSRDQPDYLKCLVRLQVQNISARYAVFITDTTTDSKFGTNGILTMTLSSILTCCLSETFTV